MSTSKSTTALLLKVWNGDADFEDEDILIGRFVLLLASLVAVVGIGAVFALLGALFGVI